MSENFKNKKSVYVIVGILIFLFVIIFSCIGVYNGFVKQAEATTVASSNIDTQLQRRADLIPNLVNTVKGYASHEKEIFEKLAESRAQLSGANTMEEKANANSELSSALNRLMVIVENYPNLKADANFTALMDELSGTENRLTVARKDYNEAVRVYNQSVKTFPKSILAGIFNFKEKQYFEAAESSKKAPSVEF